jgi:hypothetical protein
MYGKEYKAWIAREAIRPLTVEMVDTFKTFWAAKITLMNQTAIPASMHGYGMAAVNNNDSVALYEESIANFGAAYATTHELVKSQGTTIASMQGQNQAMQQYCMALGQHLPPRHLHVPAATVWPPRCIASTFNWRQKKSSPNGVPTARRISWRSMPVPATYPVQDVCKLELLPYAWRGR